MTGEGEARRPLAAYDPANLDERERCVSEDDLSRLYLRASRLAAKVEFEPEAITVDEAVELGELRRRLRRDFRVVVP